MARRLASRWRWDSRISASDLVALRPRPLLATSSSAALSAGCIGSGSGAHFTAIWGTREDHDARTWRMTGSPGIAAIDNEVKAIMSAAMIRGGSIAITLGTRLVYARGYTFAEPGYPDAQPTTTFRQASVSKTFGARRSGNSLNRARCT